MQVEQYVYCAVELWGSFFCLVAAFAVFLTRHGVKGKASRLIALMLCCSAQLCADAFTWFYRADPSFFGLGMGQATFFLTYFFAYGTFALAVRYVAYLIGQRCDSDLLVWAYVEYGIAAIGVVCLVANVQRPFLYVFDVLGEFVRLEYYWMLGILGMLGLALALGAVISFFDDFEPFERVAMVCFLLLPFVAVAAQIYIAEPSFMSLSITISTLVLFFAYEFSSARRSVEIERRLNSYRVKLLTRQIKPHFIFNCLSLIRYMSRRQPDEVSHAVDEFASFLRACTDMIDNDTCVPASKEFELVRHYVYLQERRFEGEFCVEYDLRDTDFELPALSVQTSVENAITHGLRGPSPVRNGRVVVRSYVDGRDHVVRVEDNGSGFDTSSLVANKDGHKGIAATRDRVEIMCGGTYSITSEQNKGTVATIRVPVHADRAWEMKRKVGMDV